MLAPLVPSPLDYVGRRPFALYPPIRHPDPNEWRLGSSSRTEVQVLNARTGREVWIARQYIAGVSETETAMLTVGLTKELDYDAGTVAPRVKRVIEMPQITTEATRFREAERRSHGPAPVVTIRLEPKTDSEAERVFLLVGKAGLVIALVCVLVFAADHLIR